MAIIKPLPKRTMSSMKLHLIPQFKKLQTFNIIQNGLMPPILHMQWSWWTNPLGHMLPRITRPRISSCGGARSIMFKAHLCMTLQPFVKDN
jgi:hypothetical protein